MIEPSFALLLVIIGAPILFIINLLRKQRLFIHFISQVAVVYGAGVCSLTLVPMIYDPAAAMTVNVQYLSYNVIPLKSIAGALNHPYYMVGLRNVLGNFLLLLPLGILMGIFNVNSIRKAFLYGLGVSLGIELLQILQSVLSLGSRSADVDDLILNAIGAVVGYLLFRAGKMVTKR